jgi:hypothetical protein
MRPNFTPMNTISKAGLTSVLAFALLPRAGAAPGAESGGSEASIVAVSSKVSADYSRKREADGSYAVEAVAFGKGGIWGGSMSDKTLDRVAFDEVAKLIAGPMAAQHYVSGRGPNDTKILVMVYWGATEPTDHSTNSTATWNLANYSAAALAANHPVEAHFNPSDSYAPFTMATTSTTSYAIRTPEQIDMDNAMTGAMAAVAAEDRSRDDLDARNAAMLGYDGEWDQAATYKSTPLEFRRNELVNEIEEGRYFVVLMAYDFQLLWKQHKTKLLWETRYSIRQRGNDFEKQLAEMSRQASAYFGRPSGGLIRTSMPEGHVEIGQEKVLALGSPK